MKVRNDDRKEGCVIRGPYVSADFRSGRDATFLLIDLL